MSPCFSCRSASPPLPPSSQASPSAFRDGPSADAPTRPRPSPSLPASLPLLQVDAGAGDLLREVVLAASLPIHVDRLGMEVIPIPFRDAYAFGGGLSYDISIPDSFIGCVPNISRYGT